MIRDMIKYFFNRSVIASNMLYNGTVVFLIILWFLKIFYHLIRSFLKIFGGCKQMSKNWKFLLIIND